MPDADMLFEELLLGNAQGGRKPRVPVMIEQVRELTDEDLEIALSGEPPADPQVAPNLLSIKHAHHRLAQLIAVENVDMAEVSLITGYSPAYISVLKTDPAFKELLEYYRAQKEAKFVDVLDRMKTFGLTVLDELQRRFEVDPEDFKKSELLTMTDLLLLRGQNPPQRGQSGGSGDAEGAGGVHLNISFVTPAPVEGPMAPARVAIEHE